MKTLRRFTDEILAGLFICGWLLAFWVIDNLFGCERTTVIERKSEVDRLLESVWEAV